MVKMVERRHDKSTHLDGFPEMVRVVRRGHPLEGGSLALIGWMRRRGALELLLVLADGSRVLVPAAWTDLEGNAGPPVAGTLGSLEDLLAMRRVLDWVVCAGLLRESASDGRGVVLAGRDHPAGEKRSDAVASGSGGVTGARSGAVGAGRLRAAPGGVRVAGGADRVQVAGEEVLDDRASVRDRGVLGGRDG